MRHTHPARRLSRIGLTALMAGCGGEGSSRADVVALDTPDVQAALDVIRPEAIERHIRVLAHDSLEGRAPGTPGFAGAARYAEESLRALGLEPAGIDGTFQQPVPLRQSMIVEQSSGMWITSPSGTETLAYDVDFYLSPDPLRESVDIDDVPVAFAGFGVSAPALGYDDYADIDVAGKVVVFLSGAPAIFPSNERAYYSSGATKQSEAIARGAVGTLTFWAPEDPRFRWDVNAARAKRGSFAWLDADGNPNRGNRALLGSDYFAQNPTVPRSSIVANFSLDMPFLFHPLLDIVPYGAEHSSLGTSVATAADHLGLGIGPDPIPEQVLFIRSDHFSFIRRGIPALFIKSGFETGDPALDGGAINTAFRQNLYHTPFDEADQGFDFEAGATHARVNFLTGYIVAQETPRPTWNAGDFFGGLFGGR